MMRPMTYRGAVGFGGPVVAMGLPAQLANAARSRQTTWVVTLLALMLPMTVAALPASPAPVHSVRMGKTIQAPKYFGPNGKARPGVGFFNDASAALKKGDIRHAIYMFKVSASYAYKSADYDLALIYFRGEGVPVDRPLGAAWAMLAADGDKPPLFVIARDAMLGLLTKAERKRADKLWSELRKTYGARARKESLTQWLFVMNQPGAEFALCEYGSVFGFGTTEVDSGESLQGAIAQAHAPALVDMPKTCDATKPYSPTLLQNPGSPIFHPRIGTTTVGPLQQVKPAKDAGARKTHTDSHGGHPQKP